MKNDSRVLSSQSLENIDLLKLASEASQENFEKKNVFLTTKYEQIVKLEHLLCPKVGGGGTNPLVPPTFESGGGLVPPCPPSPTPLIVYCDVKQPIQLSSPHMLLNIVLSIRRLQC